MLELFKGGAYLKNGTELIADSDIEGLTRAGIKTDDASKQQHTQDTRDNSGNHAVLIVLLLPTRLKKRLIHHDKSLTHTKDNKQQQKKESWITQERF